MCRVLRHYFGVVQAQQTYTNHTIPELTVCRLLIHKFGVVQAQRTSSNLHEPHHHRASKVCRVLKHSFGVVQAQRTNTNHTITEIARCVGCLCTSSGWFKHSEPTRTTPSRRTTSQPTPSYHNLFRPTLECSASLPSRTLADILGHATLECSASLP